MGADSVTPKQAIEAAAKVAQDEAESNVNAAGRANMSGRQIVASHRESDAETAYRIAAAIRAIPIPEPPEDDRPTERVTTEQSDQLHQALKASAPDVVDARLFHPLVHDRTDPALQSREMTTCSWCGADMPGKRRGRKGARVFCGAACCRAFFARAREIGAAILMAAGKPAKDYCINSAGRSG